MRTETRSFYETAVVRAVARGMLGETPLEMHRRLRLERAASQLLASTSSITVIAFDAGYDTHEAFTRAFRAAYGTSPSAFRTSAEGRRGCARPPQTQLAARSGIHFSPLSSLEAIRFTEKGATMNVSVEEMPALRVATVPHVGSYNRISEAFERLGRIAGPAGLLRGDAKMLAIYHDDPETTPADQLRSDAGLTVPDDVQLPTEIVEKRLPAGPYARATHLGPYATLGDTWARMMGEWLPESGYRVGSGASYEVYRNNPSNARPEELRTDLYIPLA